jgi:hypothetical protein
VLLLLSSRLLKKTPEFREELQSLSSEEQLGLGGPLSPILEVLIDKRMEV